MMIFVRLLFLFFGVTTSAAAQLAPTTGQLELVERIVAIVDDDVVLQSELDKEYRFIKNQIEKRAEYKLPPEDILRRQVLERLIVEKLQLQEAGRIGIRIDDVTVNDTLRQMASNNGMSLEEFRQQLLSQDMDYLEFREDLRKDITLRRLMQAIINDQVVISEQEIEDYLTNVQSANDDSQYLVSHIQISIPEIATPDVIQAAKQRVDDIHHQLTQGAEFATLAIAKSDGKHALSGGDLGWQKLNELPTVFAKQIRGLKSGEFTEPLRSPRGFHILLLRDTKGVEQHIVRQAHTRHIQLKPNTLMTDEKVRAKLLEIRQQILDGADFAELAKEHSQDPITSIKGGDLGWEEPEDYGVQVQRVIESLPLNTLSEPFKSRFGWHIFEVLAWRDYDDTLEYRRNQARRDIHKRKAAIEEELWVRRLRDQAYVEIRLES